MSNCKAIGLFILAFAFFSVTCSTHDAYSIERVNTFLIANETGCDVRIEEHIKYSFTQDVSTLSRPINTLFADSKIYDLRVRSHEVSVTGYRVVYHKNKTVEIKWEFANLPEREQTVTFTLVYVVNKGVMIADATRPQNTLQWSYPWNMGIKEIYVSMVLPPNSFVFETHPSQDSFIAPQLISFHKRNVAPADPYLVSAVISNSNHQAWTYCEPKESRIKNINTELNINPTTCKSSIKETITYSFRGNVTESIRLIPYTIGKNLKVSSYDIESNEVTLLDGKIIKTKTDTQLFWKFKGLDKGYKDVTFTLNYNISGALKYEGNHTVFNWTYIFPEEATDKLVATVFYPISENIRVFPNEDAKVQPKQTTFTKENIPASRSYFISVLLPSNLGHWNTCIEPEDEEHVGRKVFIACVILASVVVCCGLCTYMAVKRKPQIIFKNYETSESYFDMKSDYPLNHYQRSAA